MKKCGLKCIKSILCAVLRSASGFSVCMLTYYEHTHRQRYLHIEATEIHTSALKALHDATVDVSCYLCMFVVCVVIVIATVVVAVVASAVTAALCSVLISKC